MIRLLGQMMVRFGVTGRGAGWVMVSFGAGGVAGVLVGGC